LKKGLLKVTVSHMWCKSDNISETLQDRGITTHH